MIEPLEIKYQESALRQMRGDYPILFSGANLKLIFGGCGVVALLLAGWFITPSTVDQRVNIALRFIAFCDAYFLFGLGGILGAFLASPILVRLMPIFMTALLDIL